MTYHIKIDATVVMMEIPGPLQYPQTVEEVIEGSWLPVAANYGRILPTGRVNSSMKRSW